MQARMLHLITQVKMTEDQAQKAEFQEELQKLMDRMGAKEAGPRLPGQSMIPQMPILSSEKAKDVEALKEKIKKEHKQAGPEVMSKRLMEFYDLLDEKPKKKAESQARR